MRYEVGERVTLFNGDALTALRSMPSETVQCCVTSPPYWGLRDYGTEGQIGLEAAPDEYVAALVEVFREVRRVLRDDGTLWLNLGDSYAGRRAGAQGSEGLMATRAAALYGIRERNEDRLPEGLKPKDLVGIPWRVAFALQADGWWLRSDIIWAKPNPMPERSRPTKAHEYVFLLSKSERYFYDADAIAEAALPGARLSNGGHDVGADRQDNGRHDPTSIVSRNRRSVWTITTKPYAGAHFATFPPELPELCIKAGTSERGCCPLCAAPWERVVEPTGVVLKKPATSIAERRGNAVNDKRTALSGTQVTPASSKIIGWLPSCDCEQEEEGDGILIERPDQPTDRYVHHPEPYVVLDPFAGAGTTLWMAKELGRKSVGIEINPGYCRLIEERCAQGVLAL